MKEYTVTTVIETTYQTTVEAKNEAAAQKKALETSPLSDLCWEVVDFGPTVVLSIEEEGE